MGAISAFSYHMLICGLLVSGGEHYERVLKLLSQSFGPLAASAGPIPFNFTSYYDREMGPDLQRYLLAFEHLVDPARLAHIKTETNSLEEEFISGTDRSVNIDPGILGMNRFVLASTKDNAHRIPLQHGIFAELTLLYQSGDYVSLPWTYADFKTEWAGENLKNFREIYKRILRGMKQQA